MERQSCCRRSFSSLLATLCCATAGLAQQPAAPNAATQNAPAPGPAAPASKPAPLAVDLVQRAPLAAKPYCGIDCLYALLRRMGASPGSMSEFENRFEVGPQGVSAEVLSSTAAACGAPLRAVTGDIQSFLLNQQPAILHVQVSDSAGHYILLLGASSEGLAIMDPMLGVVHCSGDWFRLRYQWDGFGLVPATSNPASVLARVASPWFTLAACVGLGFLGAPWPRRRSALSEHVGSTNADGRTA